MKTAAVLSIVAMAAANHLKIENSVLESLQQSSTVTVFVVVRYLSTLHNANVLIDFAKCSPSAFAAFFDCKDLTQDEVYSIAAHPDVEGIRLAPNSSAADRPNITPEPTTTAATPTHSADPPNITPKSTPTVTAPTHSACNEKRDSSDDRD
ncbi:hypothetical protein DYB37_013873 [Aphanomyces astaci]|uniref:Uncharacterized protein n=1 Tax=Aphanomyces astaci TaxID=112090 RepID=A0A3R7BA10_APHAT|nr:hypothetical protein DYB37_013873 [Aphanomyces astaci]